MADTPFAGPSGEADLDDDFRSYPPDCPVWSLTSSEQHDGRRGSHRLAQDRVVDQRALGEPGADHACVVQLASRIIEAEGQSSDAAAGAAWGRPAEHDEVLPAGSLDLEPAETAAGAIGRIGALDDE